MSQQDPYQRTPARQIGRFGRDERGTVAIIFSLVVIVLMGGIGLMIDGGRAYHAATRAGAALDAAALAAAKAMNEDGLTGSALSDYARSYFEANIKGVGADPTTFQNFALDVDSATGAVTTRVEARVDNYFAGLFGVPSFQVLKSSTAVYNIKDIELAMMLDVTGSMCSPCSKIRDLKAAAKDLVDILMNGATASRSVKIGLAPYSASVNAGAYARAVADPRRPSRDGCVIERSGPAAYDDTPPGPGHWLGTAGRRRPRDIDPTQGYGSYRCPRAEVMALTTDKVRLKQRIDSFSTGGWTSGHLGIAWAWYLVSPRWASIWPASAQPVPYGDTDTIKAVLLMTDGIFNTAYQNGRSADQARALCSRMKQEGIIVYAVAFQSPASAAALLQECSTPSGNGVGQTFFNAANGGELRQAFRTIAAQLNTLRLAK